MLVLFVLAALAHPSAAEEPQLLRLQKSADAMGSTFTVELYGYDRVKMEAAADAALDEARRPWTTCFRTITRRASGAG